MPRPTTSTSSPLHPIPLEIGSPAAVPLPTVPLPTAPLPTAPLPTAPLPVVRTARAGRAAPHHLLSRLQLEWDRLVRSPEALSRARRWELPVASFASLDELLRLAGMGADGPGRHLDDELLGALVSIARHDELAARVVFQRLLPGVAAMVRRRHSFAARLDATDELLAATWTAIRTYPIERRPHYVAVNLLRAANDAAFRRPRRRLAVHIPRPISTFELTPADEAAVTPAEELAELLDLARHAGMEPELLDLAELLGRGESTLQIAARRAVTDRTIRNHRAVLAHRLRTLALAAS